MNSWLVRAYVVAVDLAAATAFLIALAGGLPADLWTLLLLASLAALVGARAVRFPALKTEFVASHPFVFCALASLGPLAALIVALDGVTVMASRLRRHGPIRVAFNLGAVPLCTALASAVYFAAGARPGGGLLAGFWALAAATATYFVLNTGLVAVAISLERRASFYATWRKSFQWTAVSYFMGLTLAVGLLAALRVFGPVSLALGVPPCWLLAAFYRSHRERLDEHQRRIEEVQALNAELERKVESRTQQLQDALDRLESSNRQLESANNQLVESNDRLAEASRAKSEFLANVSHEVRTPLNAVIGFSELLADSSFDKLSDRQREFVGHIHEAGELLLSLINDILDLSKIEAGRMEVRREETSVRSTIGDAVSMLEPLASKKALFLSSDVAPDVVRGFVDAGMLRQILVNLLGNAIKFTAAGGRVEVRARRDGADLLVTVADTGIGIPLEYQQRIFQEFFQVDGSYSRKYQGTGLGLALVRRMVDLHSGSLDLESSPGEGSRFTFRLPTCLSDAPAAAPKVDAPAEPPPELTGRTILVVEDNAANRVLVRNTLRSRGYRVLEATSGEEALDLIRRRRPDLVLMDIQLPGLNGIEVTRRLMADPSTSDLRIVALTAYAQEGVEERAREAGCAGYITKPIRPASLPSQIESYFERQEDAA